MACAASLLSSSGVMSDGNADRIPAHGGGKRRRCQAAPLWTLAGPCRKENQLCRLFTCNTKVSLFPLSTALVGAEEKTDPGPGLAFLVLQDTVCETPRPVPFWGMLNYFFIKM